MAKDEGSGEDERGTDEAPEAAADAADSGEAAPEAGAPDEDAGDEAASGEESGSEGTDDSDPSPADAEDSSESDEAEDEAPAASSSDDDEDGDQSDADEGDADEGDADEGDADKSKDEGKEADAKPAPERRASKLWWALPILMLVEFYMYGHNGRLEICVGKEGDTDFSLVGQERTDENRWKFPRCETRLNLGLRSEREARVEEGVKVACRGATIFRHQGEAKACVTGEKGWVHQVEGHFVPPWDPAYYQHLFWFLQ